MNILIGSLHGLLGDEVQWFTTLMANRSLLISGLNRQTHLVTITSGSRHRRHGKYYLFTYSVNLCNVSKSSPFILLNTKDCVLSMHSFFERSNTTFIIYPHFAFRQMERRIGYPKMDEVKRCTWTNAKVIPCHKDFYFIHKKKVSL